MRFNRNRRRWLKTSGGTPSSVPPPVLVHEGDDYDDTFRGDGRLSVIPVRPYIPKVPQKFEVDDPGRSKEPLNVVNQLGPVLDGMIPVVTTNHFESYLAAFAKRSNSQPELDLDVDAEVVSRINRLWDCPSQGFEPFYDDDDIRARWMEKFDDGKQARMTAALRELSDDNDVKYLGTKDLSVKLEALLKRHDPTWAPRLIYAGNDAFNAITGPAMNECTKRLADWFEHNRLGRVKFRMAYGRSDVDIVSHLTNQEYTHCVEGDFSANDLRQLASVADMFDLVLAKLGASDHIRRLMLLTSRSYKVQSRTFGHTAYLKHQLATGTTATTVRNSFYNASLFAAYMDVTGNEANAVVLGDDLLAVCRDPVDVKSWEAYVSKSGMKLKGFNVRLQGQATLLSRRIVVDVPVPCMMPRLFKALARFNCRVNLNNGVSDDEYMAGKSLSYAYEFRHFPLFRDMFVSRALACNAVPYLDKSMVSWFTKSHVVPSADILMERISSEEVLISDDMTREMLMDAYGLECGLVECLDIARNIILRSDTAVLPCPGYALIDLA